MPEAKFSRTPFVGYSVDAGRKEEGRIVVVVFRPPPFPPMGGAAPFALRHVCRHPALVRPNAVHFALIVAEVDPGVHLLSRAMQVPRVVVDNG